MAHNIKKLTPEQIETLKDIAKGIQALYRVQEEVSLTSIAKLLGISRQTLYIYLKEESK